MKKLLRPTVAALALLVAVATPAAGISKIYVLSSFNGDQLDSYTPDGQRTTPTIHLGACGATGVAVDSAGKIYISSHCPQADLRTFDSEGKPASPGLKSNEAQGIAVDASGKLYLLRYSSLKKGRISNWGQDGQRLSAGVVIPVNGITNAIALGPDGRVYVVAQTQGLIKVYDSSLNDTGITIRGGMDMPRGVAVGPDGTVYAASGQSVTSYGPNGEHRKFRLSYFNKSLNYFDRPQAVAVDAEGNVYVAWSSSVGVYAPDGTMEGSMINVRKTTVGIAVR